MTSDSQLIRQILSGKTRAFQELVEKYQNQMYSVCLSILKSPDEAKEATQDTFIKVYKSLKEYKSTSKLSSWMYKIAYRTSLDYLRKRKSHSNIETAEFGSNVIIKNSEENLEKTELQEQLLKAISFLSPEEGGLVRMFYLEELSIKELEKITGLGKSNIKVKLFRARKKLSDIIREHFSEVESYLYQ